MRSVNLAITGLGFMGATHTRAALALDNVKLVAVVESDPKKRSGDLRDVGGNLGLKGELMDFSQIRQYERIDEALADREIDAIDICLPTDLHATMAIAALNAGKHVLVEKPLALNEAQAESVLRAAELSGKILMTGQVLRFLPAYAAAARIVKSGEIGPVRMALFRRHCARPSWGGWLTDPARSGGGIFDLLIHDVDYSISLFGEPQSITAAGSAGLLAATFQYADSGPVIIEGGWHAAGPYPFSMSFTIAGESGTLEFQSSNLPLTISRAGAQATELVSVPDVDGFQQEIRYFAECIASNRQPEKCPPRESATAVKVALDMLKAATHQNTTSNSSTKG
jgi:predicted dehydrogenase